MDLSDLQQIRIGTITLDHLPQWTDEYQYLPKTVVAERTLAGSIVTQTFMGYGGRPITLAGGTGNGWLTRATVIDLVNMASDIGVYSFPLDFIGSPIINPEPDPPTEVVLYSLTCRFRQEDAPAVEFSPISLVDNPGDDFWYTGTIKLITV